MAELVIAFIRPHAAVRARLIRGTMLGKHRPITEIPKDYHPGAVESRAWLRFRTVRRTVRNGAAWDGGARHARRMLIDCMRQRRANDADTEAYLRMEQDDRSVRTFGWRHPAHEQLLDTGDNDQCASTEVARHRSISSIGEIGRVNEQRF